MLGTNTGFATVAAVQVRTLCCLVGFPCFATFLSAQELVKPDPSAAESILVTAGDFSPYSEPDATTATKTATPVIDVPQSIITVTRQLIDDQNDVMLDQALENVAGINTGGPYRDFDQYRIRGFNANGRTFLDGLTVDTEVNFQEELFGLDRVEIVQGRPPCCTGRVPRAAWSTSSAKHPGKRPSPT